MLSNIIDRIKLPFRKDKELYSSLYHIIGFYPHDISYYKLALMHKSLFRRNAKGKPVNNERLEFLGDAILDAAVGDIVYRHFPGKREGFLTNTRSKLVQRETLNRLAQEMGISKLVLSNGRSASHNSYMGGNAFEARRSDIPRPRIQRLHEIHAQSHSGTNDKHRQGGIQGSELQEPPHRMVSEEPCAHQFRHPHAGKGQPGKPRLQVPHNARRRGRLLRAKATARKRASRQRRSAPWRSCAGSRSSSMPCSLPRPSAPRWRRNPWRTCRARRLRPTSS